MRYQKEEILFLFLFGLNGNGGVLLLGVWGSGPHRRGIGA